MIKFFIDDLTYYVAPEFVPDFSIATNSTTRRAFADVVIAGNTLVKYRMTLEELLDVVLNQQNHI